MYVISAQAHYDSAHWLLNYEGKVFQAARP